MVMYYLHSNALKLDRIKTFFVMYSSCVAGLSTAFPKCAEFRHGICFLHAIIFEPNDIFRAYLYPEIFDDYPFKSWCLSKKVIKAVSPIVCGLKYGEPTCSAAITYGDITSSIIMSPAILLFRPPYPL